MRFKGVTLRQAAGTRLCEETRDLALVAAHLRRSSLDTARDYAKANNMQLKKDVEEKRAEIAAGPRLGDQSAA